MDPTGQTRPLVCLRILSISLSLSDGSSYKLDVESRSLACVKHGSCDLTVA